MKKDYLNLRIFNKSSVENILTLDCFLNLFSLDQIPQLSDSANAKYGISFGCSGNNFLASGIKFSNLCFGTISNISYKSVKDFSNSDSSIPQKSQIRALSDKTSSNPKSGINNLTPLIYNDLIKSLLNDSGLKNENKMLASTINSIYITP